ncbi:MAG: putative superfamily hydrolase involved in metabolism [Clostridiales bacterium]|nr:putative superfamily hydrolase involved in metabolism [Clostridiales bacterium]
MIKNLYGVPNLKEAKAILEESAHLNPGPWVEHSIYVGKCAALIAEHDSELDKDRAYVMGMLHDIGRRFGKTNMRHVIDGYNFLMERGYPAGSQICMTHSFPYQYIDAIFGKWDCTDEEHEFAAKYIHNLEYNDYDKLIQLCDALALPEGYCLLEKRMMDVALRHGVNEYTVPKWKETFKIQKYFEGKIGCSIYSVLPGVVENTFGIQK